MIEVQGIPALKSWVRESRSSGKSIALVPTMGFLHEGHLSLVDAARTHADLVVMSIFVNPLQFGPAEDLARYPRDLGRDRAMADARGVDLLFVPAVEVMYPAGSEVRVVAGATGRRWEGEHRPGHFDGVLTVVAKLFHLVEPHVAVFGQKDFQQATLIRAMVRDLDWPLEVVVQPTRREPDGLAMSSRNVYLGVDERGQALGLSRALHAASERWRQGERSTGAIEAAARAALALHPGIALEYIAIVDPATLEPVATVNANTVVMLAGRVGATRLIDNMILGQEP